MRRGSRRWSRRPRFDGACSSPSNARKTSSIPTQQRAYLTFVVVGGGPTGVEFAGAIADISRTAMRGDFRRIDPARSHIVLVEAAPRVLTTFSEEVSERARRDLVEIGVEVRTNAKVEAIDGEGVTIAAQKLLRTVGVLGCRRAGRASADRSAARDRSRRPYQSEQRLLGPRSSQRLHRRRHGLVRAGTRQVASRRRSCRDSGRRARGEHDSCRPRPASRAGRFATTIKDRWPPSARAARWRRLAVSP